jgi:hypothetical protein
VEDFDFEPASEPTTDLALRTEPTLLLPNNFDSSVAALRKEIDVILRHAKTFTEITSLEQRDRGIEAGQLLQVMAKNVVEFYKPIKQAIDQLKQPILNMEHLDADALKTAKERLVVAIQEFESRQTLIEAAAMEQAQIAAAAETPDGELPLPVIVPAVVPAKTRGKVETAKWHAEIVDFLKLVQAVASGQVLIQAVLANQKYLDKRADSDRKGMNIPGVEARETKKIHFRV